jgi:hypothetical protein
MQRTSLGAVVISLLGIAFLLVPASPAAACSVCISEEGSECDWAVFTKCTVIHFTNPPRCFNYPGCFQGPSGSRSVMPTLKSDPSQAERVEQCVAAARFATSRLPKAWRVTVRQART